MSEYIIDPVIDQPDFEVKYSQKYDLGMSGMPIQYLNGVDSVTRDGGITPELAGVLGFVNGFGNEFDDFEMLVGLGNINDGRALYGIFLTKLKQHLLNTRAIAMANPGTVTNSGYNYEDFVRNLNYLIDNFDQAEKRNLVLDELSGFDTALGFLDDEDDDLEDDDLDGLGGRRRNRRRARRAARKTKRAIKRTARKAKRKARGGFFKRVGKGVKNFRKSVTKRAKKIGKGVAKFGKKVGKAIARYNPASVSIRGGLTVAFKTNLLRISEKLGYGYWSEAQAKAHNLDVNEWKKYVSSLNRVKKIWKGLQGKPENLKKFILQGWSKGVRKRKLPYIPESQLRGLDNLQGMGIFSGENEEELGAVATASTAAASGFIATIAGFLKKLNFNNLFNKIKANKTTGTKEERKQQRQTRRAERKVARATNPNRLKLNLKPVAQQAKAVVTTAKTAITSKAKNTATAKARTIANQFLPQLKLQSGSVSNSAISKKTLPVNTPKIPIPGTQPTVPTTPTQPQIIEASAGSAGGGGSSTMLIIGGIALAGIVAMSMGKKKS